MFKRVWQWLKEKNRETDGDFVWGLVAGLVWGLVAGLGLGFGLLGLVGVLVAGLVVVFGGVLVAGLVVVFGVFIGAATGVALVFLIQTFGWLPVVAALTGLACAFGVNIIHNKRRPSSG
jgi:hypothetical protein